MIYVKIVQNKFAYIKLITYICTMKQQETTVRVMRETLKRLTKSERGITVAEGYICIYNIKWDKDGQKVELPKAVAIPKEMVDADFDVAMQGADFLSDHYGWCVKSFEFEK